MSEDVQEYGVRSEMETVHELSNPDPDPDLLPALRSDLELQEQTAGHLIRAILKADSSVEALERKRDADVVMWNIMIDAQRKRVASWRACVRDWMLRNEVTKLQAPFFTASISKGRTKKVVQDEQKAIAVCEGIYPKAVQIVKRLVKAELDVAVDTFPKHFEGIVSEETSDPGLVIRKR